MFTNGRILSISPVSGIGYAQGAGGSVSPANKGTAFTLNTVAGVINIPNSNLNAGTLVSATWTNSVFGQWDSVIITQSGGTLGAYFINVVPGAGTGTLNIKNITAGALAETFSLTFTIIKGTPN
jgi:hypothetical protein